MKWKDRADDSARIINFERGKLYLGFSGRKGEMHLFIQSQF